ncbi:MAG: 23S rRNA pseudouridine(1911/1915/1917) synthase RluD [Gammaproteobacteria bacterium]|nr:23S rRNA pseudouridine(1911/1915/1917) synthase RluD [Gammaproteobacteria bacterium]
MNTRVVKQAEVPEDLSGKRLDQAAAKLFPDFSRARLQHWIKEGSLRVNGDSKRNRDKVLASDVLSIDAELSAEDEWSAEPMALDVVYEDESLIVINKQAGAVVHPAAGHRQGTLLNGLLHYCQQLELVPRAGIVHRLDKDTTGLMVVAKTLQAHTSLVKQLQARTVSREYEAVVNGILTAGGTIDQPLGRHPVNRKKQAVLHDGKEAITHFTVIRRFRAHTHVRVKLETGRTHQIRVHFAHLQYPLVGDRLYGGRLRIPAGCSAQLEQQLRAFSRQALHARRLGLLHPDDERAMDWETELPVDMQCLLSALEQDSEQ